MTATSPISPLKINASCRLPLFTLFAGAACWLALSSVLGLIASLKFHAPALLADSAPLSYGRAYAAWGHLLVYGFCVPAGMGVGVWLLAQLGKVELARPWLVFLGAKLWHIGVLVGLVAILCGQNTGYEWFELPGYAAVMLFVAFLLMTVWAFVTYVQRADEALQPSHWFLLGSLFWFAWIFSTASLLLHWFPVRGVVQACAGWWFAGNLLNVWMGLAGLAATFYLVPKLTGQPLQSPHLALFAFLSLILFGTWTGIPANAPLPAWMPTLSGMAGLMAIVPALAVVTMVRLTARGSNVPCKGGPLCFTKFGVWSWLLASLLLGLNACPVISRITDFTWYNHGLTVFRAYGFFAMTMVGAIYYILPLLVGEARVCQKRMRASFWLLMPGVLLFGLPLVIGGIQQGFKLVNPDVPFLDATKSAMMMFRLSTLGETLILVGNGLFCFNVLVAIAAYYFSVCRTACNEAMAPLDAAGVKS